MVSQQGKGSQFAGAAAVFKKKEKEVLDKNGLLPAVSPRPSASRNGNSSTSNIDYSPKRVSGNSSLKPPPFVSPGAASGPRSGWNRGSGQFPSSTYLDKASVTSTPTQKPKFKLGTAAATTAFNGLVLSPSPDASGKQKVDSSSWRDKAAISFQATSPGVLKKNPVPPTFNQHFGGSFLQKTTPNRKSETMFEETPDIKIEVKIPDIDKKIRARRESVRQAEQQAKEENVPEWLMKQRQREANRIRRENEKQERSAALIQAYFLGWKARAAYPKLVAANADRLREIREKERMKVVRLNSAIKIQKTWRMYLPRKRYLYVRECKRRRQRNEKEIKRISKLIAKMPKDTKADIKNMKKEYADKKKEMKKNFKNLLKEDGKRLEDIQKSGRDMIEYLKNEKIKLLENQEAIKAEHRVLEKQLDLLTQTSDEIARNFESLQAFVEKKKASIQKNEINSQKCRQRYLPKYRALIKDRDRHAIVEHRIANLYKTRLERIVDLLIKKCSNQDLVFDAKEAMAACKLELESIPKLPVPDSLIGKL